MFARLSAIGVRLALDDFGTGYSSLGYLKKAPFNKIKIDQSFVRGASIPGNRNAAIIKAIVALAETLEMETTAEGAETHDEVALIRSLGCSHVQGYIFGKPMLAGDARHLIQRGTPVEANGFTASRDARTATLRSAILHLGDRSINVRVRNISSGGLMAEGSRLPALDNRIEVEFSEGQKLAGEIRWNQDGRFGIKFDQAFSFEQIAAPRPVAAKEGTPRNRKPANAGAGRRSGSRAQH